MADVQFGAYVAARANKAAPADADKFPLSDSAAGGVGKHTLWSDIKTALAAAAGFITAVVAAIAASTTHLSTLSTNLVAAFADPLLDIVGLWRSTVLTADRTNSTLSLADVTGLSFPVIANRKYQFRFVVDFTAAATTTGAGFAINGPALTRLCWGRAIDSSTTGTTLLRAGAAYDTPAVGIANSAATAGNLAVIEGFVECSASGTVILRFVSEVDTSAIVVKAGSSVEYVRVT